MVEERLSTRDNSFRLVTADGVSEVVLDGLVLQGASGGLEGAGLGCLSCSITIRNTTFTHNGTAGYGGGIYASGNSTVSIADSEFLGNSSSYVGAGIALLDTSSLFVSGTLFKECFATINSGGIWANSPGTSIEIRDSRFVENTADDATGALASSGQVLLSRTLFDGNSSFWGDGAVAVGGSLRAESCSFVDNTSLEAAGGISVTGSLTVLNSEFSRNWTADISPHLQDVAAAINCSGILDLVNTTFSLNEAPRVGAIVHRGDTPARIANVIIWDNAVVPGSVAVSTETPPLLSHSILEWILNASPDSEGNFAADPLFVHASTHQLELQASSPAIAAGDTFALPEGIDFDLAGNPRFTRTALDIGAYEALGPLSLGEPEAPNPARFDQYLYAAPNPFNPSTTIYYGVPDAGHVELTIYDLAGRRVKTLIAGHVATGDHEIGWDGRDAGGHRVASGVYLYRLSADEFTETKRMVLLK